MAAASSVLVAPNGTTPVATVPQNQGAGTVQIQQISIVDPVGTGSGAEAATVDAGGNLSVKTNKSGTCTPAQQTIAASATLAAANTARVGLSAYNYGPGSLYIGLTSPCTQANNVYIAPPNSSWTMPVLWVGNVYCISDDPATTITVADFSP